MSLPRCKVMFSPVGRMWLQLHLRVLPSAMVTTYEWGVSAWHLTISGFHLWLCGLSMCTGSSGCKIGSCLDVLSYCNCCFSCRVWSLALMSPSAYRDRPGLETAGKLVWYTLEFKSSTGDGMLWSRGVLHRHNMARWGSEPDFLHFCKRPFTVCTALSIKPLAYGKWGLVVTCTKPYVLLNPRNNVEVIWVLLPVMSLLGMPCSSNMDVKWAIVVSDRMLSSCLTRGNLL